MRRSSCLKCMAVTLVALTSLIVAHSAFGYPPDNAAVLYYKAALMYGVQSEDYPVLTDLRKGKTGLNDKVRKLVKSNRHAIDTVLDACEVRDCDWGINLSQGFEAFAPNYAELRALATLIGADAKIHAENGQWKTALNRCLSLHKMANHINDSILVSNLVGIAINTIAHEFMAEILSAMPPDAETLTWLKTRLMQIDGLPLSVKPALAGERQTGAVSITPTGMAGVIETGFGDDDEAFKKEVLARIRANDEAFFATNRTAWLKYWDEVAEAFDLPYPQAHLQLKKIFETYESRPDLVLLGHLAPACGRVCTMGARSKAHYNAMRIAIDLYIAKAQTGRLPDALPAGVPNDPFSGKPFRYEKTADGFILHCQGKDLDKDKTYEYAFKVAK